MIDKILILSQERFERLILPKVDELSDTFFISILDPDTEDKLREDTINFKTWKFYDLEEDINTYKAISSQQAEEISQFINDNFGKKLIVHCHAGISRSSAIAEFYFESLGGSYRELIDVYQNIIPNGRVLRYLRMTQKKSNNININFI